MVATPSVLMFQDTLQNIALTKIAAPENLPQVVRVQDSTTKALNSEITPTGALVIDGTLLKIEGDQLKNICKIQHTRHRSVKGFLVNLVAALTTHGFLS